MESAFADSLCIEPPALPAGIFGGIFIECMVFCAPRTAIQGQFMSKKLEPTERPLNQGYMAETDGMTLRYWTMT